MLRGQTGRCGWSAVLGEGRAEDGVDGVGGAGPLQPPRAQKRLSIPWEMTKETIWRILIRAVNLCFIKIPPVPAWRGDWMQGQEWKEGNQLGGFYNFPG